MATRILILGEINYAHGAWGSLSRECELVVGEAGNREDFLNQLCTGHYNGITIIYRTIASASFTGLFDDELIKLLPESIRFIVHNGAGYDQIDILACSKKGIKVSNVVGAVDDSTADTALFLLIGAFRSFNSGIFGVRQSMWKSQVPIGHSPHGKTLGIIGMGGIGRSLATRAQTLGMRVQYYNRRLLSDKEALSATYCEDIRQLLQTSDAISIHVPSNKQTFHMISREQFALMKDGVIFINTARGGVVDEVALVEAINARKVFSAGLDVYENEPEVLPELMKNEQILLLPHLGTWTEETMKLMEESLRK